MNIKIFIFSVLVIATSVSAQPCPWLDNYDSLKTIAMRVQPPEGYCRVASDTGSFASWLGNLSLKDEGSPVYLYDGSLKRNQDAHHAVIDIDTGDKNLQQCADAVIRLRAEYLFSTKLYDSIVFNFTSGDPFPFRKWLDGYRPVVNHDDVSFIKSGEVDSTYKSFRSYLDIIFTYAGSYSLQRQLDPKTENSGIAIGDVFVRGGFPGHAVIVIDKAVNKISGAEIILLVQSYMPAQDIHILKNPVNLKLSPWYDAAFGDTLVTPEWTFTRDDLRRF